MSYAASPDSPDTPASLGSLVRELLEVRTWTAHDLDTEGRVLAGHDEHGSSQLVEIAPDGTRTPLTALDRPARGRYVPGRRQVIVEHDAGGNERMQLSLLDLDTASLPAGPADLIPLVHDAAYLHVLQDVTPSAVVYTTNRRNDVDFDVVVRDLDSGAERVVYDGGGWVMTSTVSHDLQRVAMTALSLRPNGTQISVGGEGGTQMVTDPDEDSCHEQAFWAGDDRALIFASNRGRDLQAVVRAPLHGGHWTVLVEDPTHDLDVQPSPDGSRLLVGRIVDGSMTYAVHTADGAHLTDCDLPPVGLPVVRWAADSSAVLVAGGSPVDPGSIFVVDAASGASRRVVDGRAGLPAGLRERLALPTMHRVPTPDGELVPCKVFAPSPGADPRLAGASVVHVHGGPEAAAYGVFNPSQLALVAAGFTVLVPDVRGSTGYGKRWYSLDDLDKRLDSVADLAAIHAWLPSLGLDPARSALWGGSYGGYMVLAGLTMQPELWAAGVDVVGISSLVTFLENTSAYRRAYREREYGSVERDREMLERFSPITHLHALRAPLFVIHGANDPRVPLSEAEQIHAALVGRGVRCELRVYADEGHGLAKRANRLDAYPAAIAFLADELRLRRV
ncbi:MAG TPA: prolyl oligopeptidase family serine peptidase [Dermatophilaceae bacterium]|nr:prolyl oligopeptidase family serine peptidase [Dermatophilaceae bacterium]